MSLYPRTFVNRRYWRGCNGCGFSIGDDVHAVRGKRAYAIRQWNVKMWHHYFYKLQRVCDVDCPRSSRIWGARGSISFPGCRIFASLWRISVIGIVWLLRKTSSLNHAVGATCGRSRAITDRPYASQPKRSKKIIAANIRKIQNPVLQSLANYSII